MVVMHCGRVLCLPAKPPRPGTVNAELEPVSRSRAHVHACRTRRQCGVKLTSFAAVGAHAGTTAMKRCRVAVGLLGLVMVCIVGALWPTQATVSEGLDDVSAAVAEVSGTVQQVVTLSKGMLLAGVTANDTANVLLKQPVSHAARRTGQHVARRGVSRALTTFDAAVRIPRQIVNLFPSFHEEALHAQAELHDVLHKLGSVYSAIEGIPGYMNEGNRCVRAAACTARRASGAASPAHCAAA